MTSNTIVFTLAATYLVSYYQTKRTLMKKNIIIVGSGMAGLSAGIYARMNGYKTSIFEMHNVPGGLCTAWERKGYRFDISMHMLTGSVSGPFHEMWKELGIVENFNFHFHDHIALIEGKESKLLLSTNKEILEKEMLAIAPEDKKLIKQFVRLLFGRDMMNAATLKPKELTTFRDSLRTFFAVLPMFGTFGKYGNTTLQQFTERFKSPFLREAIRCIVDAPGWPMLEFPMIPMAGFIRTGVTEAGAPLGGSQQVAYHLASLFRKNGGEFHYKSRVTKLITEKNTVKGIELEDGTQYFADTIIWAGDGHTLIYDILEGKYTDERIKDMYDNWIPVRSIVHVMLGVNMDLSKEPHRIIYESDDPITIAGKEFKWQSVLHHCFDKTMAPEDKSAVEVWYDSDFEYWEELYKDKEAYKAEKKRIADYTIQQLDKRWPGFASKVQVVDVPTPATYMRYTGNWKGSPDGWYITPHNMQKQEPLRKLPGLEGLWMAGQWTAPFTGTVVAALTGRQVIQLLCKQEGKSFTVS